MENTQLLSSQEMREHAEDEAIIERGLKSFYEVGSALLRIRERRSYRDKFKTFEEYCRVRWDMGKNNANYYIGSTKVVDNIRNDQHVGRPEPLNMRQTIPLQQLNPEQQQEAWKRALDVANREGRKVTAKLVEEAVAELLDSEKPSSEDRPCFDSDEWWLTGWEQVVQDWLRGQIEAGRALMRIRGSKAWGDGYASFEAFCQDEFDLRLKEPDGEGVLGLINMARMADIGRVKVEAVVPFREDVALIHEKQRTFVLAGYALKCIKEDRLWKSGGYDSFGAYVEERWGFALRRATTLIDCSDVARRCWEIMDKKGSTTEHE